MGFPAAIEGLRGERMGDGDERDLRLFAKRKAQAQRPMGGEVTGEKIGNRLPRIAFLFLLSRSFAAKRFGAHEATTAVVTSYYWHFVDVVWIALFSMIYLVK